MSILHILHYPDPGLDTVAAPVDKVDETLQTLLDDMLETMYGAPGVGLAATQVGILKRVIVLDISEQKNQPFCLINPEIVASHGSQKLEEGCLSVPGIYEMVERAEQVMVRGLDREGMAIELEAHGLLAVCLQHEIDHLDGKVFVDHLSMLKRSRIKKKLEKMRRQTII